MFSTHSPTSLALATPTHFSSSKASSRAVAWRCFGSRESARRIGASNTVPRPGTTSLGGSTSSRRIFASVSLSVSPLKRRSPVSVSQMTTAPA